MTSDGKTPPANTDEANAPVIATVMTKFLMRPPKHMNLEYRSARYCDDATTNSFT
jgi:hypothetical protein